MPIGNAIIHLQINVSEFINKLVSFLFCEFNPVTSWKEDKNIILERSSSLNPKKKYWFHFQVQRMSMWSCLPNSNFEGNFSTYVFGKSFWHYRDLKSECWTSRHTLRKKILNFFICVEVRILCKKVKYLWISHFPEAITKTCRLETTPLCLNTRLRVNKKFKNSQ